MPPLGSGSQVFTGKREQTHVYGAHISQIQRILCFAKSTLAVQWISIFWMVGKDAGDL